MLLPWYVTPLRSDDREDIDEAMLISPIVISRNVACLANIPDNVKTSSLNKSCWPRQRRARNAADNSMLCIIWSTRRKSSTNDESFVNHSSGDHTTQSKQVTTRTETLERDTWRHVVPFFFSPVLVHRLLSSLLSKRAAGGTHATGAALSSAFLRRRSTTNGKILSREA
jgi:hypothetical protein